jgi:hypothetical protein
MKRCWSNCLFAALYYKLRIGGKLQFTINGFLGIHFFLVRGNRMMEFVRTGEKRFELGYFWYYGRLRVSRWPQKLYVLTGDVRKGYELVEHTDTERFRHKPSSGTTTGTFYHFKLEE